VFIPKRPIAKTATKVIVVKNIFFKKVKVPFLIRIGYIFYMEIGTILFILKNFYFINHKYSRHRMRISRINKYNCIHSSNLPFSATMKN
jgi:hypothetical protein